jgi:TolB protein
MAARELRAGQRSRIHTIDVQTGADRVVHESEAIYYEAPNWTLDGAGLIINGAGRLFRLALDGDAGPQAIDFGDLPPANNDHVLDPDGVHIFFTARDGHIYRGPLAGGMTRRVTPDDGWLHFLHGVSPDGLTLAYIGIEKESPGPHVGSVWTMPAAGGRGVALTADRFHDDGSEFSPDGRWLYFNSERADTAPGHAQLFRMRPDGDGVEQLTFDERVNWFPHVSPDGTRIAYISFPPGTLGHPPNLDCIIRVCGPRGEDVTDLVRIFGGQGSLNVPSWSPDSQSIAYIDYPLGGADKS